MTAATAMAFRPESSRVYELDGIRGCAILMVMIGHLSLGAEHLNWPHALVKILDHGWMGVDLFFVLSGFLISGIFLDGKESRHYFRNFYARRALRILPLYLCVIAVLWICYPHSSAYALLSLAFLANFYHAFGISEPKGMAILWSLAVEEHFYLLWPTIIKAVSRHVLLIVSILLFVLTPVLRGVAAAHIANPEDVYYFSFYRFDGMALGALIAIWVRSRNYDRRRSFLIALGFVGAAVSTIVIGRPFGVLGRGPVALALRFTQGQLIFGSILLIAFSNQGRLITAPLRSKLLVLAGELSYCLYLIHLALIDFVGKALSRIASQAFGGTQMLLLKSAIVFALSFAIASLSWVYFESPILRLRKLFPSS